MVSFGFPGGTRGKGPPANAGDSRDIGLIPGLGRSSGVGNGYPLQDSCLENAMDRGGWWATVHGVTKSQTQLSNSCHIFYTLTISYMTQWPFSRQWNWQSKTFRNLTKKMAYQWFKSRSTWLIAAATTITIRTKINLILAMCQISLYMFYMHWLTSSS